MGTCISCRGKGLINCPSCNGRGTRDVGLFGTSSVKCKNCNGSGKVKCPNCNGKGFK